MRRAFVAKENFDFSHREIGRAEVDEFEQRITEVVFAFESESNDANTIGTTGSLYIPQNISLKERSFLRPDHPSDHLAQGWRFTIEKPKQAQMHFGFDESDREDSDQHSSGGQISEIEEVPEDGNQNGQLQDDDDILPAPESRQ